MDTRSLGVYVSAAARAKSAADVCGAWKTCLRRHVFQPELYGGKFGSRRHLFRIENFIWVNSDLISCLDGELASVYPEYEGCRIVSVRVLPGPGLVRIRPPYTRVLLTLVIPRAPTLEQRKRTQPWRRRDPSAASARPPRLLVEKSFAVASVRVFRDPESPAKVKPALTYPRRPRSRASPTEPSRAAAAGGRGITP